MEKIAIVLLFLLCSINSFGQNDIDTIRIRFDKKRYNQIASDSLKNRFYSQKKLYENNILTRNKRENISLNYGFEQLHFYSIPIFRIKAEGRKFSGKNNIEDFIDFDNKEMMQNIIVLDGNENILTLVDIPNLNLIMESENSNKLEFKQDRSDVDGIIYNSLLSFPESHKKMDCFFREKKTLFFFKILGIENVLFEVDKSDNKLYATYIGSYGGVNFSKTAGKEYVNRPRTLANEYIFKYAGYEKIRDLAIGIYDSDVNLRRIKKSSLKSKKTVYFKIEETNW
ncbi:hypothetical protein Flavo103_12260 [Flavobacterium collinsii]|uniref:hypothetical protein n=1 Tax=Flavobacterium collinsii TaxID=1114861 RepID=UPI0022C31C3A|nr:hypothetical protein [Flavobacterium collinsii]GIQ58090.1 hypothetical protein Flavo103_12260 [Flavobacterium collinsii]